MKMIGVPSGWAGRFRTGAGCLGAWVLAGAAILSYMGVNMMFAEVGEYVAGSCASLPVLLFGVACVRNGVRFTAVWSALLLGLAFLSFVCYGMDAGLGSFVLAGVLACAFMSALVFGALAYRPQDGAMGALWRTGVQGVQSVRGGVHKGGGVSLLVALMVCNVCISLMGVLV